MNHGLFNLLLHAYSEVSFSDSKGSFFPTAILGDQIILLSEKVKMVRKPINILPIPLPSKSIMLIRMVLINQSVNQRNKLVIGHKTLKHKILAGLWYHTGNTQLQQRNEEHSCRVSLVHNKTSILTHLSFTIPLVTQACKLPFILVGLHWPAGSFIEGPGPADSGFSSSLPRCSYLFHLNGFSGLFLVVFPNSLSPY